VTYSDGSSDQTTYNGLMVTRANAKSQTITSYSHRNGAVAETLDALGNATTYAVGAFGTVLSVTDPAGTVTYTYDTLGHRLTETDPDTNTNEAPGTTTMTYSSFGPVLARVTRSNYPTALPSRWSMRRKGA
jgi:YD repeat-containing protein